MDTKQPKATKPALYIRLSILRTDAPSAAVREMKADHVGLCIYSDGEAVLDLYYGQPTTK